MRRLHLQRLLLQVDQRVQEQLGGAGLLREARRHVREFRNKYFEFEKGGSFENSIFCSANISTVEYVAAQNGQDIELMLDPIVCYDFDMVGLSVCHALSP